MKVAALNFEQAQHDIVKDIEAVNAWSQVSGLGKPPGKATSFRIGQTARQSHLL